MLEYKRCIGGTYGNFSKLADAKLYCMSDSNCEGITTRQCYKDKNNRYHLCRQTETLGSPTEPMYPCVYTKLGIQTFYSSTVVLVVLKLI